MKRMNDAPGYWMHEQSGVLRPAVEAYLNSTPMTSLQIALLRDYLRQWIGAPVWRGPAIDELRRRVDGLTTREAVGRWLKLAERAGIDPL